MRKAIRKIIALGMGAAMIGATILGASAAGGLNQYPSPFIKNGVFDGKLVVGNNAAAEDILGVSSIMSSLQYASTVSAGTSEGGQATFVEGDVFEFKKSSNKLEFEQQLKDIASVLTSKDLDILADKELKGKTRQKYTQKLNIAQDAKVVFAIEDDISEDPQVYLKFENDKEAIEYEMRFASSVKSDIDNDNKLEDFENEKITLLGRDYTITSAEYLGKTGNDANIRLTLMAGAVQDTLEVGQTKTYSIGGKDYEATVMIVSGSNSDDAITKMIMDDEVTPSLKAGDTYTLDDGTVLGIKEVLPTKSGDVIQNLVEFYLGANKIVLEDDKMDIGDNTNLDNVDVQIGATVSGSEVALSSITMSYTPTDDIFVEAGKSLLDGIKIADDDDGLLFMQKMGIDYQFVGLAMADTTFDNIKLSGDGDDALQIEITNKNSDAYEFDIFYRNSTNQLNLGEEDGKGIYFTNGDTVKKNEKFIIDDGDKTTRVLQLKKVKADVIEVTDIGTKDSTEFTINSGKATLTYDGQQHVVNVDSTAESINLTQSAKIYTEDGTEVKLNGSATATNLRLVIDENGHGINTYGMNITTVGTEINYNGNFGLSMLNLDSNDDVSQAYTPYGTLFEVDKGGDQAIWEISIPDDQLAANVFLKAGEAKVTTVDLAKGKAVILNKIDTKAAVLASELSDLDLTKNLILVGGPCANPSMALISSEFPTCDNWTLQPGEALIQMVKQADGKVALLVAGTDAADTRAAAGIVTDMTKLKALPADSFKQKLNVSTMVLEDLA